MTVYAIHFCSCGWKSPVHEDDDPAQKHCPKCKRELYQARSIDREAMEQLVPGKNEFVRTVLSHFKVEPKISE